MRDTHVGTVLNHMWISRDLYCTARSLASMDRHFQFKLCPESLFFGMAIQMLDIY